MNRLLHTAALLIAGVLTALTYSCREEGEPTDDSMVAYYQNIVSYAGNHGPQFHMTYCEIDDSPEVTLIADGNLDSRSVPLGTRLVISYSLPHGRVYGESGTINLTGISLARTATIDPLPAAELPSTLQPVYVTSLYRSSHYINLVCSLEMNAGLEFLLYADETTLAPGSTEAHLYLSTRAPALSSPAHNATYAASFDISPCWDNPEIRTVVLHVNNSNNIYRPEFTFTKP